MAGTTTRKDATNGTKKAAEAAAATADESGDEKFAPIVLTRLKREQVKISIVGMTPLIPHRWAVKAREQMLAKHQGRVAERKAPKNPEQEARDATYWCEDGRAGMPATAFKGAIADAARFFDKTVTIEMLKRVIFVFGEGSDVLVPIDGELTMREDTPRNSGGTPDLRYRNQLWPWSAELHIEYLASMLTQDALVSLVDAAGRNGVGDWRPSSPKSKTGTFGMFKVAT